MERRIGSLRAEVIDPESAKFTAPLLLLHGLWSSPAIWRPFTGYLAHRGWLSVAPHLQLAAGKRPGRTAYEEAVRALIAALPAPPVIIGHDFGAVIGLRVAGVAVAVVALAPLVLPPLAPVPPALRKVGSWFTRVTKADRPLRAPRGAWQTSYPPPGNPSREPAGLIRALVEGPVDIPPGTEGVPALVMAGETDRVTAPAAARALAAHIGAQIHLEVGVGHALPVEPGWEQRVSTVHRWIVHTVGKPLLALFDESLDE
jgi:pimeloyl-ACP methyl ester carboxylesterase